MKKIEENLRKMSKRSDKKLKKLEREKKRERKLELIQRKKLERYKKKKLELERQKKFEQNKITREKEKLKEVEDELFVNLLFDFINIKYQNRFTKVKKSRKYDLKVIIREILYFLRAGISYKNYRGTIKKSTLNYYINLFSIDNIFSQFYWHLYEKYSKINTYDKLKYLSVDTSFATNFSGLNEDVGRNPLMKGKNCIKISLLVDKKGMPIHIKICKGNESDSPLLREHFKELKIDTRSEKMSKNNRYKPYLMADAMYDAKESREILKNKGYIVLIPGNRRKTGREAKKFTPSEKITYKKRNIIENTFARIKQFRRLNRYYEKNLYMYFGLLHLSLSRLIFLKK